MTETSEWSLGWQILLAEEIGYVFRLNPRQSEYSANIYWVDVEVYEIYGFGGSDANGNTLGLSLMPREWTGSNDPRPAIYLDELTDDNAEWTMKGYIKWDGCSNMEFNNCVHLCGMHDAKNFSQMIVRLWEKCQSLCQTSDEDFD